MPAPAQDRAGNAAVRVAGGSGGPPTRLGVRERVSAVPRPHHRRGRARPRRGRRAKAARQAGPAVQTTTRRRALSVARLQPRRRRAGRRPLRHVRTAQRRGRSRAAPSRRVRPRRGPSASPTVRPPNHGGAMRRAGRNNGRAEGTTAVAIPLRLHALATGHPASPSGAERLPRAPRRRAGPARGPRRHRLAHPRVPKANADKLRPAGLLHRARGTRRPHSAPRRLPSPGLARSSRRPKLRRCVRPPPRRAGLLLRPPRLRLPRRPPGAMAARLSSQATGGAAARPVPAASCPASLPGPPPVPSRAPASRPSGSSVVRPRKAGGRSSRSPAG
jgi:hypothetical protein